MRCARLRRWASRNLRKSRSLALKQTLQISGRQPKMCGDTTDREITAIAVLDDVGLRHPSVVQRCATSADEASPIVGGAKCQSDQVV